MVIRAAVVVMDNSPCARNGDVLPNRLQAAKQIAQEFITTVRRESSQNIIGVAISHPPRVTLPPTTRVAAIMAACKDPEPSAAPGSALDAAAAAALALHVHSQTTDGPKIQPEMFVILCSSVDPSEEAAWAKLGRECLRRGITAHVIVIYAGLNCNAARQLTEMTSGIFIMPRASEDAEGAFRRSEFVTGVPESALAMQDFGGEAQQDPELLRAAILSTGGTLEQAAAAVDALNLPVNEPLMPVPVHDTEEKRIMISGEWGSFPVDSRRLPLDIELMNDDEKLAWAMWLSLHPDYVDNTAIEDEEMESMVQMLMIEHGITEEEARELIADTAADTK